jgi:hypothetical protein
MSIWQIDAEQRGNCWCYVDHSHARDGAEGANPGSTCNESGFDTRLIRAVTVAAPTDAGQKRVVAGGA